MDSMQLLKVIGEIHEKFLSEEQSLEIENFGKKKRFTKSSVFKVAVIIGITFIFASTVLYGTVKIYEKLKPKIVPSYTSNLSSIDESTVWIGTFNLVWNDFMDNIVKGKIEFEDGIESNLAKELNKRKFTISELSENSYFKFSGKAVSKTKEKIENEIKEKLNAESDILDKVNFDDPNGIVLYAMLKKEFTFLEGFDILNVRPFNNSEEKYKYFGVNHDNYGLAGKNVEVLFYNSKADFAVKLKTREGEEVILYKSNGENKSFEDSFEELVEKTKRYEGDREFNEADNLVVPFISLSEVINYDELCGRMIKGTNYYIQQALQTVNFELTNMGGSVKSEALLHATMRAYIEHGRDFLYTSDFLLYLKEEDKTLPYLALKVSDTSILVQSSEDEYYREIMEDVYKVFKK